MLLEQAAEQQSTPTLIGALLILDAKPTLTERVRLHR